MHAFDYTAVDFLIALHDFGVINRSQLLLVGLGLKGAPSGPVKPCHAECSWGCTAGLGTKAKPLAAYCRRLCCLSERDQYKISKTKFAISMIAVAPATESINASLSSW